MFILIGGVPGVGKTTVTQRVEKLALKNYLRLERVYGTHILRELAGVATLDELRALSEETRASLRPEMYRRLYENDRNDIQTIRLIDGHFVFFDINGEKFSTQSIFPQDREQMMAVAVITAEPETILLRRQKDAGLRKDRQLDIDFIRREQCMELETANSYAHTLNIPIAILKNETQESRYVSIGKEMGATMLESTEGEHASQELLEHIRVWSQQIWR